MSKHKYYAMKKELSDGREYITFFISIGHTKNFDWKWTASMGASHESGINNKEAELKLFGYVKKVIMPAKLPVGMPQ